MSSLIFNEETLQKLNKIEAFKKPIDCYTTFFDTVMEEAIKESSNTLDVATKKALDVLSELIITDSYGYDRGLFPATRAFSTIVEEQYNNISARFKEHKAHINLLIENINYLDNIALKATILYHATKHKLVQNNNYIKAITQAIDNYFLWIDNLKTTLLIAILALLI